MRYFTKESPEAATLSSAARPGLVESITIEPSGYVRIEGVLARNTYQTLVVPPSSVSHLTEAEESAPKRRAPRRVDENELDGQLSNLGTDS